MSGASARYMIGDVPAAASFHTTLPGFTLEQDTSPAFAEDSRDGMRLLPSGDGSSGKRALADGRRAVLAYLAVVVTAYLGFLLCPTLAPRPPEVVGDGFFAWGLRYVYGIDPPYNCVPSLHVAYSFLAALGSYRVHRGLGLAAILWAALIALSMLFTKQHYVADVLVGIVMAWAAYLVFRRGHPRDTVPEADRLRAPRRALAAVAVYAILVAALWAAYRNGATPR